MTTYTGEIAFEAGPPAYWDEIVNLPVEPPQTLPTRKQAHRIFHDLSDALQEDNHVKIMELPPQEYQAESVRQTRQDIYASLGASAATCVRNDMLDRSPHQPGDSDGAVVHKGMLGEKQILTVSRTIVGEDGQTLRQLSVHNLHPLSTLLRLSDTLGVFGVRGIVSRPPGTIAPIMQLVNEYTPSEKALARVFLAGGRNNRQEIENILALANRWTASDRDGLWLTALFVNSGYKLPADLDPGLTPYAYRLGPHAMNPEQDLLLLAESVERTTARIAERTTESTNPGSIADTVGLLERQRIRLQEL